MPSMNPQLAAHVTVAIEKYAEGAVPGVDKPFDEVKQDITLEQAINMGLINKEDLQCYYQKELNQ